MPPSPFSRRALAALPHRTVDRDGVVLCVLSAAGFGAMAVLVKLAYAAGVPPLTLLALRFALAAGLLWGLARHAGAPVPGRRLALAGLSLGLVGYSLESGMFFLALTRTGASVAELLFYAYPALVVLGAFLLGRERLTRKRLGALAAASAGVVLVLAGGGGGAIEPLGAALALGAAIGYGVYVLVADRLVASLDARMLGALVCTGCAVTFSIAALLSGQATLQLSLAGWGWTAALVLLCTVLPLGAFMAGVRRVGPGRASIISTVEPPVTVILAFIVFGERLGSLQLAGGALVVGAVVLLAVRRPLRSRPRGASPHPPARPAARALPRRAAHRRGLGVRAQVGRVSRDRVRGR